MCLAPTLIPIPNGQYMELEKQLDKGVRNHGTSGASGEKGSFR